MAIKFKNAEVAKKYDCTAEVDVRIDTPEFGGMLSNAPLAAVEGLIARKSNYAKPIAATSKVDEPKK